MNIYFLNNTFLIAQFLSAIFLLVVFIYAIFQASKVVNLSLLMLENEYLDTSNMATAYVSLAGSMFVFFCGAFAQAIMFDSGINNEPSVFYIITNTFSLCVGYFVIVKGLKNYKMNINLVKKRADIILNNRTQIMDI